MEISTDKLLDVVNISLELETEYEDYFEHFRDCGTRDQLQEVLDDSGETGWFCAKVTASLNGVCGDPSYLGCCSYDSTQEFKNCDYYTDLTVEAVSNLKDKLESIYSDVEGLV